RHPFVRNACCQHRGPHSSRGPRMRPACPPPGAHAAPFQSTRSTAMRKTSLPFRAAPIVAAALLAATGTSHASSHREAPFISTQPKVDATDFYMFNSYEAGRSNYVTLLANYEPLQDAYGGPNYFALDPRALYEIHVDNNGDGSEDLTFQFRFTSTLANNGAGLTVQVGDQN